MIDREKDAQENGAAPTLLKLPVAMTDKSDIRDQIEKIVTTYKLRHLDDLIFHHNRGSDIRLICARNPANSILIRPYTTVPIKELDRMVVLDASWPIKTLLTSANENMAEEAKAQGLQMKSVERTWPCFKEMGSIKRYDHVTIHLMPTKRSGRLYSIDDADPEFAPGFAGNIVKEIVKVIASIPRGRANPGLDVPAA